MRMFDASSMLHAWEEYLPGQLLTLWDWLGEQVQAQEISLLSEAMKEVTDRSPDCACWLRANGLRVLQVSPSVASAAMDIKRLLRISDDQYHPKGVDENDILIIAAAQVHGVELISNENQQPRLPQDMRHYKIPAVCALPAVSVVCLSFRDYLAASGQVFR